MEQKIKKDDVIDGRYHILEKLGEGGMSIVFRARDKEKKTDVAVKFFKSGVTSSYIEDIIRFKREIESVSKLDHPCIIRVYNSGEHQNTPYIVMEYIKGNSLEDIILEGKSFNENDTVSVIKQVAEALSYVHGKGIIHRDLKPGNILLIKEKNSYRIKLLDFGVALVMELGQIKGENEIVGTFGYMSPEATGIVNKPVDERSDLYSLGILFYRLLSGSLPFKGKELSKILHQQVAVEPPKISKIKPSVSVVLEDMISKLLFKEPEMRYQSAKGLIYDLERYTKGVKDFIIGEKDQKIKLSYQTRLIGRESELNKIRKSFNLALEKNGNICLIGGEPGIGKSRLVEEIRGYCYEHGGLFIGGRCYDQENKIPYQPFRDSINGYIQNLEKMDKKEKDKEIERIKKILGDLGEIVIRLNGNMGNILGKVKDLIKLDPERENQRYIMVLSNFFCNLVPENKVCALFLDDLQWADEGSLNLLEEIASNIEKHNLLILGTFRDNEVDEKHSLTRVKLNSKKAGYPLEEIIVEKFTHNKMNKLVSQILGEEESKAHRLTDYILEKTNGNTFFAINIIRELVEEKAIIWKEGTWQENWEKIKGMRVSANMIEIILKRIEELPADLNEFLCLGSVIGREFEIRFMYKLLPEYTQEQVVKLIDDAIGLQLLERSMERGKVLFVHDRIKEAFYKRIGQKIKKRLHLKVAVNMEEMNKDDLHPVLFDLAHHYIEGGEKDKAIQFALPAAEKAKTDYANEEAIKYYQLYIRLLEERGEKKSPSWIKAKEGLADVYLTIGNNDEAISISEEIMPLKKTKMEKAGVYRKIGTAYYKKGDWKNCEDTLAKGLKLLGITIPINNKEVFWSILKELIIHVFHMIFYPFVIHKSSIIQEKYKEAVWFHFPLMWMYALSNLTKAVATTLRLINLAESKIGKSKELNFGLMMYGAGMETIGIFRGALRYQQKAYQLRKESKEEYDITQSLQQFGYYYYFMGQLEKSIDFFLQSKERHQKMGDMWEIAMDLNGLGHNQRYLGRY
ncbi:MAG: protein kinase, partial [Spirochaetes bacterium]|nr:protein kinase [Spirochaetota bacterium]